MYVRITNSDGKFQYIYQECLILRETLDHQYILLGNDFLTANAVIISFGTDNKSVTINNQSVEMCQPTIESNLVSFFSAELTQISHKCRNVTLNHSAHILPDRSATL